MAIFKKKTLNQLRREVESLEKQEDKRIEQASMMQKEKEERARLKSRIRNLKYGKELAIARKVGGTTAKVGKVVGRGAIKGGKAFARFAEDVNERQYQASKQPNKPRKSSKKSKRNNRTNTPGYFGLNWN